MFEHRRPKELSTGLIKILRDGEFFLAVSRMTAATEEYDESIVNVIAGCRERYGLSVEETSCAIDLVRKSLESTPNH